MYTSADRDQLYEIAHHVDFDDLRHLCQSNRLYNVICQEERFQKLIQHRYNEMISTKVNNTLNILDNLHRVNSKIVIDLQGDQSHRVEILKDNLYFYVSEKLTSVNYNNSIVYQYAENLIQKEYGDENLDFPALVSIDDVKNLFSKINRNRNRFKGVYFFTQVSKVDEIQQSKILNRLFETLHLVKRNENLNQGQNHITFSINFLSRLSLIDLLTLIYKRYPNLEKVKIIP